MPLPGMYGMEHIGFTVPDINVACDWFERILGAETLYTAATDFRHDDDWMQEHLRVCRRRRPRTGRSGTAKNSARTPGSSCRRHRPRHHAGADVLSGPRAFR